MESRRLYVSGFNAIVSEDVATSVAEWDPTSVVLVTASHTETVRHLAEAPTVFAVIAWGSAEAVAASGLPGAVAARGGHLVWATDMPVRTGEQGWMRLDIPFNDVTLHNALDALAGGAR